MRSVAPFMQYCPCGTGKDYIDCCGIFISGQKSPPSPEALMRSRYTAYHEINLDYIVKTMKSPAADNFDVKAAGEWAKKINWTQLEIIKTTGDSIRGFVEFCAHYYYENKKSILHEISEFHLENGEWYYVNGIQPEKLKTEVTTKIGRNDLCPCGSHKKYKKCLCST
jgi:SEC-C motif-containing protein